MDRGKKSEEKSITEVKAVLIERPTPPQEEETTIKSGLTTNQTLLDNKLIHLTSTNTSHAQNIGAVYDSLLQEETDKPIAIETTSDHSCYQSPREV